LCRPLASAIAQNWLHPDKVSRNLTLTFVGLTKVFLNKTEAIYFAFGEF
jgi:hypothetical protein